MYPSPDGFIEEFYLMFKELTIHNFKRILRWRENFPVYSVKLVTLITKTKIALKKKDKLKTQPNIPLE